MIETLPVDFPRTIGFKFCGKLHDEDYQILVSAVDKARAEEGKIGLLVQLEDFHGWDARAAWDDLKFSVAHYGSFDRVAVVGDRRWEKWLALISRPFVGAPVKFFDVSKIDDAWAWLREGAATELSV